MKKRKTKLVLSKLPMRYFTRADLNKKTKRSLITLYLELQTIVVKLIKLKVKGIGKRLRKKKRSKKQLENDKRLGKRAKARRRR